MAGNEKRRDSKGRLLRTGESERTDNRYQFRYTDLRRKRQTIYARDLHELRRKEQEILKQLDNGINYRDGEITVIELLEKYIGLKKALDITRRSDMDLFVIWSRMKTLATEKLIQSRYPMYRNG